MKDAIDNLARVLQKNQYFKMLMEAEQVNHMIDQNVRHLEIMVAKDFWTDEDMTAINAAIEG